MVRKGATAEVIVGELVVKRVTAYLEYGIVGREEKYLEMLAGESFVPVLLGVSGNSIVTGYAGEPVLEAGMPGDAHKQASRIIGRLKTLGVSHNDIRPPNLLNHEGRLVLIDWQWATRGGTPPHNWPKGLGGIYRAGWPDWSFDDRESMARCLAVCST